MAPLVCPQDFSVASNRVSAGKTKKNAGVGKEETAKGQQRTLRLRVQSRSRTRLRIAASMTIAFLFLAYFKVGLDTIAPLSRG